MRKTLTPTTKHVNEILRKLTHMYGENIQDDEDTLYMYVTYLNELEDSYKYEFSEWKRNWDQEFT